MSSAIRVTLAVALALVLLLTGGARANAQGDLVDYMCFQRLATCLQSAASLQTSWWDMWFAGLNCELEFASCVRGSVIGW